jgi:thiosulfate reductase / polysulfide reductase chain A
MRKILRRDFLKYSAAGASLIALDQYFGGLAASAAVEDNTYVNRNTGKRVKGIATTCAGCGAGCGVIAYVSDGVVMKLSGNPAHPVNKGKLCLVGEAGIYKLSDPERLSSPVKRVGKRGQGHWKEISWEEAVRLLADNLKAGKKRLVVETRGGTTDGPTRKFISGVGGGSLVSHGHVVSANRETALMTMFGAPYDIPDIANTGYILNFGSNPFASDPFGVSTASAITDARSNNSTVKLVTIDPRLSETAGRSDRWVSITPGTDGMVALAMAYVIMHEGLYDASFISSRTDTSVAALKDHLAAYTPEVAERISGVKAEDIRSIAIEYARATNAVVLTGGGVSSYGHGVENERAVRLLTVITGKLDRVGCNLIPRGVEPTKSDMAPEELYSAIASDDSNLGVYIVHNVDPAYSAASPDRLTDAFADEARVPFLVCIDSHITDTGEYADLVLPTTSYLEEYDVCSAPGPDGNTVVRYRRPVIRPMAGSMAYLDILAMVARAAGADMGYMSSGGYVDKKVMEQATISGPRDIKRLEQDGFFTPKMSATKGPAVSHDRYGTPSGKVEAAGKPLGLPASTRPDLFSNWKQGELVLVKYSPVGYREGFTENNLLLKELNHSNRAYINAGLGRALGLKNRDEVVLSSPAGRIKVRVVLSPGVNENTVAVADGCGHKAYGNIEKGKRFYSSDPFTRAIWWGHDGDGENPNRVISPEAARTSEGAGWSLTKVSLIKA